MIYSIDLSGIWGFQPDEEKQGLRRPLSDTIRLPGTTSFAGKGRKNENKETDFLTDEYKFEGHAWYEREIDIPGELAGKVCFLYLERTRITRVWIDGKDAGSRNSLCTPHKYDITGYISPGRHRLTILVDNTNYPTKGGHMTSRDTQTNWNGITGRIELQFFNSCYIDDLQVYPDIVKKEVVIKAKIAGGADVKERNAVLAVSAESFSKAQTQTHHAVPCREFAVAPGDISVTYDMGDDVLLWSEHEPNLYKLRCDLKIGGTVADTSEVLLGMREFKTAGNKFTINGVKTFLRGKHDGLVFPLTGFAPTTVEEWLKVLSISKSYGINHYRFHTCCPPDAAFTAADMLGIYMEPELPFWGNVTDESDKNHNAAEQEYLINEGYNILKQFGNHPSFVMMSLGNELWGSQKRMNEILKAYKAADPRHLYTQGSNNFQFAPVILENEDFFCGVRFSRDRLFRGSYAMCDAPQGHVQTARPGTMKDYDREIRPDKFAAEGDDHPGRNPETGNPEAGTTTTIDIQFGTGTKKVVVSAQKEELIPKIPVVSHEIGQYTVFPNFKEIGKYTGPLKARNFEIFRERLADAGLVHLAEKYFRCSGKLAVACYKEELEAAFRSRELAGFQILDLQDFPGQGTALVGILDAFMDSKGLVTAEEWRTFCSDAVLLARFDKYNYEAGEKFKAHVELCYYRNRPLGDARLRWELRDTGLSSKMPGNAGRCPDAGEGGDAYAGGNISTNDCVFESGEIEFCCGGQDNYYDLCDISYKMPDTAVMKKLEFKLGIAGTDIWKSYDLWVYPKDIYPDTGGLFVFSDLSEAMSELQAGGRVLLVPDLKKLKNTIEGTYCTDFWCYPMFRAISESMGKKEPVGTMGLLNNSSHPVFNDFPCEEHSTYQWWDIVMNSRPVILDGTPKELRPMVQVIDNFERNHKLGIVFECGVSGGKLLVCACDIEKIKNTPEGRQFLYSIINYMKSDSFAPECEMNVTDIENLLEQE